MTKLFNYINLIYKHSFTYINECEGHSVFACKKCNTFYYYYNFHSQKKYDGGLFFEGINHEVYKSSSFDDLDNLSYDDILNCNEQIIKNLLE